MNPRLKKVIPSPTDMSPMILLNVDISLLKGVSSVPAYEARLAICPMTVLSPVNITTPTPLPYL